MNGIRAHLAVAVVILAVIGWITVLSAVVLHFAGPVWFALGFAILAVSLVGTLLDRRWS